jgi:hypothetical protein
MVMRVMLIGFLVIGAVAMLETDVSAHPRTCGGDSCCYSLEEWPKVCEQVKPDKENWQVWILEKAGDERGARLRDQARQVLKECGLEEMIAELIYKDRAYEALIWVLDPEEIEKLMKEGQGPVVIVTMPRPKRK